MAVYMFIGGVGPDEPTTVVCDFRSGGEGEITTINDMLTLGNFCGQRSGYTSVSQGTNGTLRLSIPSTDYAGTVNLGGGTAWDQPITNFGYSSGTDQLKQNLIKKAYLKISTLYGSSGGYPVFNRAGVSVAFSKKIVSSNWSPREGTSTGCAAGFVFPRGDYSSCSSYIVHPIDGNTQYLALPTTENLGENHTASGYIDQGVSCLYSRLILETRGDNPGNFHYWLIVEDTNNEYDLGLASNLGSCIMYVNSGDRWMNGSYKEISEAYMEVFDNYYIDEVGNITREKPR